MTDRRNDPTLHTHAAPQGDGAGSGGVQIGAQLGRYTIIKLLGRGGMGAVYEADDPELGRRVAIKILREDREGDTETLRREAQALARLVHQNVVMVYDVGVDADGDVFLVMQLVEGETIDDWIQRTKPPPSEIIAKFRQAGEGLKGAHAAGLVHCDFKPANVLVDGEGVVRVGDFGLARRSARITGRSGDNSPVMMTTLAGTPAYMAPEQFEGVVTTASDQFAYCVALWECLAGARPFQDSSMASLDPGGRHQRTELPRDAQISRRVKRVLERGMRMTPAERFPSMEALLEALQPRRGTKQLVAAAVGAAAISGAIVYLATRAGGGGEPVWDGADLASQQTLTALGSGGCAYAPMIEAGGTTIVFDRTIKNAVDLYTLPIAGGPTRQLTHAPTWEWRAQIGRRPGEVVHLIHDRAAPDHSQVAYLDLATGQETPVLRKLVWDAVTVGNRLFYSPEAHSGIWSLEGNVERAFIVPPLGYTYFSVTGSPSGDRLAVTKTAINGGPTQPCVVDLSTHQIRCLELDTPTRPAFGVGGEILYVATSDGIIRHDLATGEQVTISKDYAEGGLAVAPDGSSLVYSQCIAHTTIFDLATGQTLVDDPAAVIPVMAKSGAIAWLRSTKGTRVLVLRRTDGREVELTRPDQGAIGTPHFSPDGKFIVFSKADPLAGLYTVELDHEGSLRQLTASPLDRDPTWTENGYIAFTRGDDAGDDRVFVVKIDGHQATALGASTRSLYGSRGNELLVGGVSGNYWYDPATARERPGPARPEGEVQGAATSPSGNWVVYQIGSEGEDLYRARTDGGALELVKHFDSDFYSTKPTITDDGHILMAGGPMYGDLVRIPAREGFRF